MSKYRQMKYYKKKNGEPRPCSVCGNMFLPPHGNRKLCSDCRERMYRNLGREWPVNYEGPTNVEEYERQMRKRNRSNHVDTIIAIGYAERQMAASLEKAGKVKTEL